MEEEASNKCIPTVTGIKMYLKYDGKNYIIASVALGNPDRWYR